jgi:tight adherence protein C
MTMKVLGLAAALLALWLTSPLLALITAAAAWFGPEQWLARKAEARAVAIRRGLPDFLDLLAISVEAGAGLDSALARAAGEVGGPLGDEFHRLLHALGLGSSRREAFIALKDRAQVRELSAFVLALLQAEALGISLAGVLRTQATEMRAVRRRLAREQAAKAPVKILFPLVFGIFPALMLVVLGPAAIRIMQTLIAP